MRLLGLFALLVLSGCPSKATKSTSAPPCKTFGQTCQYAPGKLGSCVYKTDCSSGPDCLVCQSQH